MFDQLHVLSHAPMRGNRMDKDLTLDEAKEQWEVLRQSVLSYWEVITETFIPAIRQVMDAIHAFVVQLQRVQLCANLMRRWWIPDRLARWLSDKWPERWLPELRLE